jgi:hypothetical protein
LYCNLKYIPEHLHAKDKPLVNEFVIGEKLYYRCKNELIKRPYDKISLYDISHNRNFNDDSIFLKEDVLYNIDEIDARERYSDLEIVVLKINNLQNNVIYTKEITENDVVFKFTVTLKHSPEPCMYPHSVFQITKNDIIINKENYGSTLDKKNMVYKNIRSDIRQELTSIIQSGVVDSSQNIEIIDKP